MARLLQAAVGVGHRFGAAGGDEIHAWTDGDEPMPAVISPSCLAGVLLGGPTIAHAELGKIAAHAADAIGTEDGGDEAAAHLNAT